MGDQNDRMSGRIAEEQPTADGDVRASPAVLPRATRRPHRRARIIAALSGVLAIGLAAGITIVLKLDAQRPFAEYDGHIATAMATAQLDGRPVVIMGLSDGPIRVSDLATGAPIGQRRLDTGQAGMYRGLALGTAELDGRPVIITGGTDYSDPPNPAVRVWDLATRDPIGRPLTGHAYRPQAVTTARMDGRTVIISSADDGLRVWDLTTGTPVAHIPGSHGAVGTAQLDGRTVVISGGSTWNIRVWDLATGTPLAQYDHLDGPPSELATADLGGRPVVISDDRVNGFEVWDLATGSRVSSPVWPRRVADPDPWDAQDATALATAQLDGRTVLLTGDEDGMVRAWDLATSSPIGQPLDGHLGTSVEALATAQLDGRTVVISGGGDGTVRVWDLADVRP